MRRLSSVVAFLLIAGCATRPAPPPPAPPPPPVAAAPAAPAFAGYGNLVVPPRLPDGSFATPNRSVSAAGSLWHLRAGLNVAALACRGPEEAATVAAYNALLAAHRTEFAGAYRTLGSEYGTVAAFDEAMTRLYNYYALPPAQAGLCEAARAVLADAAAVPPGALPGFAPAALARLDAPFTAVFARQEAWLATRFATAVPLQVAASPPPVAAPTTVLASVRTPLPLPALPRIPAAAPTQASSQALAKPPLIAIDPTVLDRP